MTLADLKRKPLITLYVFGAILLLLAGILYWYRQNTNPETVFWNTVSQGLRTNGVTIKSKQDNNGSGVKQTLQYSLGADSLSYSRTTLTQGATTVVNEMIGTPSADYNRYASVKTDQKAADGRDLNFSKILGVWAKSDQKQLFSQAALGTGLPIGGMVLPIASVSSEERSKLLDQIHNENVYRVDFSKVKKQHVDGRLQYVYDVRIKPIGYARLMKSFASSIGLHDLDQLDPTAYNAQPDLKLKLTVDARAQHLVAVTLPANDYTQTYGSYDIPVNVELPKNAITVEELQKRLREL